jgi:photosystem II stability/assembly factor-like uncharacterized protein
LKKGILFISIFVSSISFSQWTLISDEVDNFTNYYSTVHFINADTGFVGGFMLDENSILRTQDGGSSWDTTSLFQMIGNNTTMPFSIHFPSDSLGYAACRSSIFKTIDYGENWFEIDTGDVYLASVITGDIYFLNNDTGYVGWSDGGAGGLRTYDGGLSWEQDANLLAVRNFNVYDGVVMANAGAWVMLDQQNMTWSFENSPEMGYNFYKHSVIHEGRLYSMGARQGSGGGGVISYSDDMGANWTITITPSIIRDVHFRNATLGYIAMGGYGPSRTEDAGQTWHATAIDNLGTNTVTGIDQFCWVNDTLGYGISVDGIYKTTNGGGPSIGEVYIYEHDLGFEDEQESALTIYPNPATNTVNLNGVGLHFESVEFYSVDGKLIAAKLLSSNQSILDVSDLSPALYLVKVKTLEGTFNTRLVVE